MNKLVYFSLLLTGFATAQTTQQITANDYNQLKTAGTLDPNVTYQVNGSTPSSPIRFSGANQKSGVCDCMLALDTTYTLAMTPNDDGSSGTMLIPFNFSFYGTPYNSLYINNNGNISFTSPYSSFTANPFPDAMYNMIAPFWADVDTRGSYDTLGNMLNNGGQVWFKITPTALIVKWEQVGYFPNQVDKLNTFQLIITDGTDPLIPNGNNVAFCYGDMQWTTGSASSGSGGIGGTPATVGVNLGNGIDFFQVGRFDSLGTAFDGPYGANDQVDFLDNLEVYFNVADSSGAINVPPMVIASGICDTIDVYTGDTLVKANNIFEFSLLVTTPEPNQEVFATITCPENPLAVSYTITDIAMEAKRIDVTINATGVAPGMYSILVNAIDNGLPTASQTNVTIPFQVIYDGALGLNSIVETSFAVYPNPTADNFTVNLPKGLNSADVTITTLSGESVLTKTISNAEVISLNNLPKGIYIARFEAANGNNEVIRIVKN